MSRRLMRTAPDHLSARSGPSISVCARIQRILQDRHNPAVAGALPADGRRAFARAGGRYRDLLLLKPQQHLPCALEFLEFPEQQTHGILDTHVRIEFDLIGGAPAQAHRQLKTEFTSLGLLANRLYRALTENAQLEFTHRSPQPQNEAIIDDPRVVDALRIDQHCAHQPAELDQMMPVSAVASQS